jgi:hypothetical protein
MVCQPRNVPGDTHKGPARQPIRQHLIVAGELLEDPLQLVPGGGPLPRIPWAA